MLHHYALLFSAFFCVRSLRIVMEPRVCWEARVDDTTDRRNAGNKINCLSLKSASHYTNHFISCNFLSRFSAHFAIRRQSGFIARPEMAFLPMDVVLLPRNKGLSVTTTKGEICRRGFYL
jgi:hypothetical protein